MNQFLGRGPSFWATCSFLGKAYYEALDAADAAWKGGNLDVGEMETLISELLRQQIMSSTP